MALRVPKVIPSTKSSRSTTKASVACGLMQRLLRRSSKLTVLPMHSHRMPVTLSVPTGSGPGPWLFLPEPRTLMKPRSSSSGPHPRNTSLLLPTILTSVGVLSRQAHVLRPMPILNSRLLPVSLLLKWLPSNPLHLKQLR